MPGLAHYMSLYDREHSSGWNKLLHGIGIPMIFAGLIFFVLTKWLWAAGFFFGGWAFLFLGHKIEGNHPHFFRVLCIYWLVRFGWPRIVNLGYGSTPSSGFRESEANAPLIDPFS